MFSKHWLTFSRKDHVGLVQNRTRVNFRTRTRFTEPILQLLNIPWYGHLHITVIHSSLCKVETATRLLEYFLHLCQSVYDKRRVLKAILVAEIEIIPWCLIFFNLSTPVHLYYRPQIKSIHVFKRIILVKLVLVWKWKCKIRELLSSHILLSSFLLRSNRTTLQAQVYRVFSHANWPIETRHSHWLCSNTWYTLWYTIFKGRYKVNIAGIIIFSGWSTSFLGWLVKIYYFLEWIRGWSRVDALLCHYWSALMCHVMYQNEATRVNSQVLKRSQFFCGLSIFPLAGYNCLTNFCPKGDFTWSISLGSPALPTAPGNNW